MSTSKREIDLQNLKALAHSLRMGEEVLLSGVAYTARDAAHKRIMQALDEGAPLPFPIEGAVIYYAGPTPTPPGRIIGSCGPTTSGRMDPFTPRLLDLGLMGMIGKGERSPAVVTAIVRSATVYFCAIGGAGALAAACVRSCEVVAYDDLGCESVKRIVLERLPVIVGIDCAGRDIFSRQGGA